MHLIVFIVFHVVRIYFDNTPFANRMQHIFLFQMSFYGSENATIKRALRRHEEQPVSPPPSAFTNAPHVKDDRKMKQKSCSSLPVGDFVAIDVSESSFKRADANR